MKRSHLVAALLAAFTINFQSSAQADTFGAGTSNQFIVDFVNVGNTTNTNSSLGEARDLHVRAPGIFFVQRHAAYGGLGHKCEIKLLSGKWPGARGKFGREGGDLKAKT